MPGGSVLYVSSDWTTFVYVPKNGLIIPQYNVQTITGTFVALLNDTVCQRANIE